jgi:hypothetical protein
MKALGLDLYDVEAHRSNVANKKNSTVVEQKRKRTDSSSARKSSRLAGQSCDNLCLTIEVEDNGNNAQHKSNLELSGEHALAEAEHLRWAGKQGKATIVGTASYQHTLMRVRTMSDKALRNRIVAMERAKGKHAVTKMRLFARVLCLEGLEDIAEEAKDALERLVAVLGEPTETDEGEPTESQDDGPTECQEGGRKESQDEATLVHSEGAATTSVEHRGE